MKPILSHLFAHHTLSRQQAYDTLMDIGNGQYNQGQITAFLTVFNMRSITVEELTGFRDAMLELAVTIDLISYDPIDLCGTGGDGKNTFNISTLASFIAAGAGVKVAKHGNYGVSSISGSSNVMQELGYQFTADPEQLERQISEAGICFLHAPLFHPAMRHVAGIRRDLGIKTFFNMLGPLVNPCQPRRQSVGVFSFSLARKYNYLFQQELDKHYAIIHDHAGYDEISLTDTARIITNRGHKDLDPAEILAHLELDKSRLDPQDLYGGETVTQSATIFKDILENKGTPAQNAAVIVNAANAIAVAKDVSQQKSLDLARESLVSGKAAQVLRTLIQLSQN